MKIPEISLDGLQSFGGRLCLVGRLRSGKDHLVGLLDRPQWGLADAMRALLAGLKYPSDKSIPGGRECLLNIGQWGRGWVDEKYPLSPERIMWIDYIRTNGDRLAPEYDWSNYGIKPTFYCDLILNDPKYKGEPRTIVSDIRFSSDAYGLMEKESLLILVWASQETICRRLRELGEIPEEDNLFVKPRNYDLRQRVLKVNAGERYSTYWTLWFEEPSEELLEIQKHFLPKPDFVYKND